MLDRANFFNKPKPVIAKNPSVLSSVTLSLSQVFKYPLSEMQKAKLQISDWYLMYKDIDKFLLETLPQRAGSDNIASTTAVPGARFINPIGQRIFSALGYNFKTLPSELVSITGPNVSTVANYGDRGFEDPEARRVFDFVSILIGKQTLMNRFSQDKGHLVGIEKSMLRMCLQTSDFAIAGKAIFKKLAANWDDKVSYQNQMTYLGANIIAQCILGIPEFSANLVPPMREVGKTIFELGKDQTKLGASADFIHDLNAELSTKYFTQLDPNKFIRLDLEAGAEETGDEELIALTKARVGLPLQESDKEKLLSFMIARRGGSRLLVVDNISATIMGGLAYINESIEIKQRLQLEINEYKFQNNLNPEDDVPLDDLRKLPYLDAIYWETLRIVSSASILVRNTSKDNTFKIKNSNNESVLHHVPRYAMLFSPLRSIHHDPKNWPNPLVFNPDNFYNVDPTRSRILRNKIFPFSIGMRVCPAQNGSIECAGKSIWVESLKHQFILDKKVETVPTDTIKSYWKDEYYAKLVPETRIDQTVSFSLTGIYR